MILDSSFQHEGARKAFEDAQKQMKSISETIKSKTASISQIKSDIEKSKHEASEAHRVEEVSIFYFWIPFLEHFCNTGLRWSDFLFVKECIKEQDALIPLEQSARQKVAELKSVLDSEKSQGSVLKAVLKAKETKQIQGIYGRMGDLGAIDCKVFYLQSFCFTMFFLSF